ncbi:tannase/feruloyl esterase family alpha/beta hydrolase [Novosphingobium profundi]|uniref:tannase/feruloyl esterase family alpha/beta hydrolase n=1 Tax=Novosphingobium profundi TaxID=1774954 RepID=UPI001CFF515D|nr:tannase/feruloyl esterase family alpha/beta hydrolase [Novosphingobium profundi]
MGAPAAFAPLSGDTGGADTRCEALLQSGLSDTLGTPVAFDGARIESGEWEGQALPRHCRIEGRLNPRTSPVDGREYAVAFVLRLPLEDVWNGRFVQLGGGGSNGATPTALDTLFASNTTPLLRGFAVIDTDGGHNASNADPQAGGSAAFGRDPQARRDHFFNAYDMVARTGKFLAGQFYDAPMRSYFMGCSEGGREALLMAQRFPEHFDGIASGAPQFLQPMQSLSSVRGLQILAKEARAQGLMAPDGLPAIHKVFSDGDLLLAANAIAAACDGADGLVDGLVSNFRQCSNTQVMARLRARECTGDKRANCLLPSQIETLEALHAPVRNAAGEPIYVGYPWDTGITAKSAGFRAWWLGDYAKPASNSIRLHFSSNMLRMVWSDPAEPFALDQGPSIALAYPYALRPANPAVAWPARSGDPDEAAGVAMINDDPDLDAFRARSGKLLLWAGAADATHSLYQTQGYVERLTERYGAQRDTFARFFVAPGVGHCRGGPGPDQADLLGALVDWVEQGTAPDAIVARAVAPQSYARPLCSYPAYAHYRGGPVDEASSFSCTLAEPTS